jgi:hypothetical protein
MRPRTAAAIPQPDATPITDFKKGEPAFVPLSASSMKTHENAKKTPTPG